MDREPLLVLLCALVSGPPVLLAARMPTSRVNAASGVACERQAWRALWAPLLPAALVVAALAGWALREPDAAEGPPTWVWIAAAPGALLWLRAARGALGDLLAPIPADATGTTGLLRPRVRIGAGLAARLDSTEYAAVHLHESAHARHHDPLRIWLARAVTALQGDSAAARGRLDGWLVALELARDEEARLAGADGAALARALVAAARLPRAGAGLTGDGAALKERVSRLLAPVTGDAGPTAGRPWPLVLAAIVVGACFGEPLVHWLLA